MDVKLLSIMSFGCFMRKNCSRYDMQLRSNNRLQSHRHFIIDISIYLNFDALHYMRYLTHEHIFSRNVFLLRTQWRVHNEDNGRTSIKPTLAVSSSILKDGCDKDTFIQRAFHSSRIKDKQDKNRCERSVIRDIAGNVNNLINKFWINMTIFIISL